MWNPFWIPLRNTMKNPGDQMELRVKTVIAIFTRRLTLKGGRTFYTVEYRGGATDEKDGSTTIRPFEMVWLTRLAIKVRVFCFFHRLR